MSRWTYRGPTVDQRPALVLAVLEHADGWLPAASIAALIGCHRDQLMGSAGTLPLLEAQGLVRRNKPCGRGAAWARA